MTILELYSEILKENTEIYNSCWVDPELVELSSEFRDNFFNIHLKSFKEIVSSRNVVVYRVNCRYNNEVQIFCKRKYSQGE